MTTMDVATIPGACPCGEVASRPHTCEHRPVRQMRLCDCGEWTYSPTCGPCRLPVSPPMPEVATVPVESEHVSADVVWLHEQTLLSGSAMYQGWS